MLTSRLQAGDTIIEVLLAVTIFSLVSVGAITIMNQGTNAAQRALEITLVRQQVDAQAESLRAAQQAHGGSSNPAASIWSSVIGDSTTHFDNDQACPQSSTGAEIGDGFIMDARTATKVTANDWLKPMSSPNSPPYAQVAYGTNVTSYGIWIERSRSIGDADTPDAYSFIIRACWYGAGMSDTPMRIETVVRLYDPS